MDLPRMSVKCTPNESRTLRRLIIRSQAHFGITGPQKWSGALRSSTFLAEGHSLPRRFASRWLPTYLKSPNGTSCKHLALACTLNCFQTAKFLSDLLLHLVDGFSWPTDCLYNLEAFALAAVCCQCGFVGSDVLHRGFHA